MATMSTITPGEDETSLPKLIGMFMSAAPGVERVLVASDESETHVWSIVNNLAPSGLHQVYACENVLLGRFPDVSLDFHVVDRRGASPEGLIPGAEIVFGD